MKILYLPSQYSQQRQREKKRWIYPIRLAMEATLKRRQGHEVYWEEECSNPDIIIREPEGISICSLPAPDRVLTRAFDRKYQENGNFKQRPATYILSAQGCWWGKCSFCVENGQKYKVREVDSVIEELKEIKAQGFREVFDDSATFPTGEWLTEFCAKAPRGLIYGCNMRFGALEEDDFKMMKDAGFRMILWGLESVNPMTLIYINKGITLPQVYANLVTAEQAGLESHLAVMFGYPWETHEETRRTVKFVQRMLRSGIVRTAQASFYSVPDQISDYSQRKYVKEIYRAGLYPDFWFNQLRRLKTKEDWEYIGRGIKEVFR